ncbi:hypothetical protein R3P38DRAFT_3169435 [Favolaschia claudopus]|uniref:Uncharacterized protein n=1 Tax=Favolaschia claudopus TaxID=2862362 RepID=A0AAW0E318_9AGAR
MIPDQLVASFKPLRGLPAAPPVLGGCGGTFGASWSFSAAYIVFKNLLARRAWAGSIASLPSRTSSDDSETMTLRRESNATLARCLGAKPAVDPPLTRTQRLIPAHSNEWPKYHSPLSSRNMQLENEAFRLGEPHSVLTGLSDLVHPVFLDGESIRCFGHGQLKSTGPAKRTSFGRSI